MSEVVYLAEHTFDVQDLTGARVPIEHTTGKGVELTFWGFDEAAIQARWKVIEDRSASDDDEVAPAERVLRELGLWEDD